MINITTGNSKVYTLRSGDKHFQILDKFVLYTRASFEIDAKCPTQYKQIIAECYQRGWLKPVANLTEREMIFMGLTDDTCARD